MTRDANKRKEWEKRNRYYIGANLMRSTDADIISYVEKKEAEGESKLGLVKRCIRTTMAIESADCTQKVIGDSESNQS